MRSPISIANRRQEVSQNHLLSLSLPYNGSDSNRSLVSPMSPVQTDTRTPPGRASEDESTLPSYTVKLQEYGNTEGRRPSYTYNTTRTDPERFVSTVTFGDLKACGRECGNKKGARHEASKALWELLNSTTNSRTFF